MKGSVRTIQAAQLDAGMTFLGPREFHVKVERVRGIGTQQVLVEGVNGWGEGFRRRYQRSTQVQVLA